MAEDTNETTAPQPGTPEYETMMEQRGASVLEPSNGDAEATTEQTTEETSTEEVATKPDNVPEKFWDAEKGEVDFDAWSKSTQELERKLSQNSQEDESDKDGEQSDEGDTEELPEGSTLTPDDFQKYSQEFSESGELSDGTYDALEKAGIPRDYVDAYIQGQQAKADLFQQTMLSSSGLQSTENFEKVSSWAQANMSEGDLKAYNESIDSNDPKAITQALSTMREAYENAKGSLTSNLLSGDGHGTSDVFESSQQLIKAMSDPRYKKDPAYRAEVESKLSRSKNVF